MNPPLFQFDLCNLNPQSVTIYTPDCGRITMRILIALFIAAMTLTTPLSAQDRSYELSVDGNNEVISVWEAEGEPKGVILFGHGWGAEPALYDRLFDGWTKLGFTVEAPLNLDSEVHPRHQTLPLEGFPRSQAIIGQRMRTLIELRDAASKRGRPVVLAGHSFGSFVATTQGEGKWAFGPLEGPRPVAILAFSSPGIIPMLVPESAYETLDLPFMMVTGTKDATGTSMPTWEAHRLAFDRSIKGDKYLVVVEDGGHNLAALADATPAEAIVEWSGRFLSAYAFNDKSAKTSLTSSDGEGRIAIERR